MTYMQHVAFFNESTYPRLALRWALQPWTVAYWISYQDWNRGVTK